MSRADSLPARGTSGTFVGRAKELAALETQALAVREGKPCLMVVEGEAGIGKTWLVRQALAHLEGFAVWWASCDPLEQDWPYGVIEQWLRRVPPDALAGFPALSRPLVPSSSLLQVGAELLDLLAVVQSDGPVVLVVDDARWADETSLKVLGFLLRRLAEDKAMVVITAQTHSAPDQSGQAVRSQNADDDGRWRRLLAGVERTRVLPLGGLDYDEAVHLLATEADRDIQAPIARRLLEHTGGHPLYLQAVATAANTRQWTGLDEHLPVPDSLADAVRATLRRLEAPSRRLVEAIAVLDRPVPLAQAGRLAGVSDPAQALGPALACGLVHWQPGDPITPVAIRHALQRDAVYQTIDPQRRQALHAAAVPMVDSDTSWTHRVAAADRTDPALAADLEHEADRQLAAGQTDRAATLLMWSADLSADRTDHERRLLAAAAHLNCMPYLSGARRFALQSEIERCAASPLRSCILGRTAAARGNYAEGERLYRAAIAQARRSGDRRTETRARIWLSSLYNWHGEHPDRSLALLEGTLHSDLLDPPDRTEARFALIFASGLQHGPRSALATTEEILTLPHDPEQVPRGDHIVLALRSVLRLAAGELAGARADAQAVLTPARSEAGLATLTARRALSFSLYLTGDWKKAGEHAHQALVQAALEGLLSGFPDAHACAAMVTAGQGRDSTAQEHLAACAEWCNRLSPAMYAALPLLTGATLAQARGDPAGMMDDLAALRDMPDTGWHRLGHIIELPLLVEALIGTGRLQEAQRALLRLCHLSDHVPGFRLVADWATGRLAEAHGDVVGALADYRRALARPVSPDEPGLYRARLDQDLGHLALLVGDLETAGPRLCSAYHRYTAMGALGYARRLAADLAQCGLRAAPGLISPAGGSGPIVGVGVAPGDPVGSGLYAVDPHLLTAWAVRVEVAGLIGGPPSAEAF